jgi:predicted nucleic acid-binding protein
LRRYLLDTTPLAAYLFGRPPAVALIGPWLDNHEAATSILIYGEVIEYLMGRSHFPDRQAQLRQLLREITPLFLSYSVLDRYALLRRGLRPPHGPGLIGDIDGLIAATALERGLTVVTTDGDFTRVPGLSVLLLDRQSLASVGGTTP